MTETTNTVAQENPVREVIAGCDRVWRRVGVRPADRRELGKELADELHAARDAGFAADTVMGVDRKLGALEWARERAVTGRAARHALVLATGLGATIVGLLLAVGVTTSSFLYGQPRIISYAASIAVAYAGALFAVSVVLQRGEDMNKSRTLHRLAIALPLAGCVAPIGGRETAAALNYQRSTATYAAVLAIITVIFALAIVTARATAIRI